MRFELINEEEVMAAFEQLLGFYSDLTPVMNDIGEAMLYQTQERFLAGGPAPDGTPWLPKQEATFARYVASGEGVDRRTLIHHGLLSHEALHHEAGSFWVELRAFAPYAAVMQFGAKRGEFGPYSGVSAKTGRRYSGVAPWGDIPARPFLGVSEDNKSDILDVISEALGDIMAGFR